MKPGYFWGDEDRGDGELIQSFMNGKSIFNCTFVNFFKYSFNRTLSVYRIF